MKQYELTVMIHPDLEMNLQPALDKVANLIESVGGTITKEVNEGKKRMLYEIEHQKFALYYYYEVELDVNAPGKIERSLAIMDEVIRHLLVLKDGRREKMVAKRKLRKEETEVEATNEDEDVREDKEEK